MARQNGTAGIEREQIKVAALAAVTILTLVLLYLLLAPFAPALIWGIALAIVAQPFHRRIERRLKKRPNLTAAITVLLVTSLIVVPVILVTQQVIQQARSAVKMVSSPEARQQWKQTVEKNPRLAPIVRWVQQRSNLPEQVGNAAGAATSVVPQVFSVSLNGATQLIIALFALYFLLRDRQYFLGALRSLVPLSNRETDEVFARIEATIDASVRGRVLIALIQGALGGLMWWWLGLPGPLLWGAAMALLALIPMLGAFVVWVPAAALLALTGHPVKALILTGWGALVVGTIDNLLYPVLVGKNLHFHTLVIFFAVLGGVAAFGVSGLVIGPVIVALADALFDIWDRRTRSRVAAPELKAA
jgi:predicted PurR-regulated permease PerM